MVHSLAKHTVASKLRSSLVLLLVGGACACAPVRLTAGEYSETHEPGVILLEGQTLCLGRDHTFAYQHWSDDVRSSRYGTGTYRLVGSKLQLCFGPPPPAVVGVQAQPLASPPDSLMLTFAVAGRPVLGAAKAAELPYATILAYDATGRVLAKTSSDVAGRAVLHLSPQARRLRVQSLGFATWQQDCPARSTAYQLVLPANVGTPYVAGTIKELRLKRGAQPADGFVVRQGSSQLVFQR